MSITAQYTIWCDVRGCKKKFIATNDHFFNAFREAEEHGWSVPRHPTICRVKACCPVCAAKRKEKDSGA